MLSRYFWFPLRIIWIRRNFPGVFIAVETSLAKWSRKYILPIIHRILLIRSRRGEVLLEHSALVSDWLIPLSPIPIYQLELSCFSYQIIRPSNFYWPLILDILIDMNKFVRFVIHFFRTSLTPFCQKAFSFIICQNFPYLAFLTWIDFISGFKLVLFFTVQLHMGYL